MKNEELFNRSVDVLVKAYHDNTLQHGSCFACAVGNLVAAANNCKVERSGELLRWSNGNTPEWPNLLLSRYEIFAPIAKYSTTHMLKRADFEVSSTGYTTDEIMRIESAFELRDQKGSTWRFEANTNSDDAIFNGLLRVYDALCEIHEVEKDTQPTGAEVFSKEKVVELI